MTTIAMRPYYAIIKDSFREALASRVLWIVFALITAALVAFAPLSFSEEATVGVSESDVEAWPLLIEELRQAGESGETSPAARMFSLMDEDGQKLVREFRGLPEPPTLGDVREFQRKGRRFFRALNDVLGRDDLYDKDSFRGIGISRELRELQKTPYEDLAERDRLRFNRLLFEASFPDYVSGSPPTSMQLRYAVWELFDPLPVRKEQYTEALLSRLPWLIDKGILWIGLLIAVLVTAPIIPQMFDPGSLHLLLSKPIARPLLYLSKFLGGCAFVLLAAAYLFVGIWLILGVQWGIWKPQLLWCIPVYVFVFATYYSVSALAGAVWRNTIVAVIATFLFWVVCFSVGTGQTLYEGLILRYRIARLASAGQEVIAADEVNTLLAWDADERNWKPLTTSPEHDQIRAALIFSGAASGLVSVPLPPAMIGPVYDQPNGQVVGAAPSFKLLGRMTMVSARKGSEWKATEGSPPSGQPFALLLEPDGRPLLVTNTGLARVVRDMSSGPVMLRLPGMSIPLTREPLASAGPTPPAYWGEPAAAAIDPASGRLLVYSRGVLATLKKDRFGDYAVEREERIAEDGPEPVILAAAGGTCFVLHKDGAVKTYDDNSLAEMGAFKLPGHSPPRAALPIDQGRKLLVLAHDGYLYQFEMGSRRFSRPRMRGQGDISAVALTPEGRLLVASQATRVVERDVSDWRAIRSFEPALSMTEKAYYWVIQPLHMLLPKPGEFYKTVEYLLTGAATTTAGETKDLAAAQAKLDPWAPFWSGLAFQAVMLLLGCLYIQRQEF